MSDDKTHKPTPKKLLDARKKGEVPKSNDVPQAAVFIAVALMLLVLSAFSYGSIAGLMQYAFAAIARDDLLTRWPLHLERAATAWLAVVLPLLGVAMVVAVAAGLAQTRGLVSLELVKLKFDKLNPVTNLKNMFAPKQLFELAVKVLKVGLLGAAIYLTVKGLIPSLAKGGYLSPAVNGAMIWKAFFIMFAMASGVYVVIAALDYGLQYFHFMRQQRMSFEDIKREYKDMEGDPHVKGQRRQMAAEMLEEAGGSGLARAKVLVTNPTHFAVALGYEPGLLDVPCVLQKGTDAEAANLREQARKRGIPIMENVRLARDLYFNVPVGEAIHDRMFDAVAEVLAWVARLEKRRTE